MRRPCCAWGSAWSAILAPLQLLHRRPARPQHRRSISPSKIAAIEAHWDGSKPGALVLFAVPNDAEERNDFEIAIPNAASLLITHSLDGLFPGLKDFPPEDRPPVIPVFFAFRIMVGIGVLMIASGWVGAWLWWRGRLSTTRWYLGRRAVRWPLGFIAILSGWYVAEIGRQPWVAYRHLANRRRRLAGAGSARC